MPINIPSGLPARAILDSERIFALERPEAERQSIRPLKLVILNLMPKKIETETQLLRLISKSPLQVEIDFMKVSSHKSTHVASDHLVKFYETLDAFQDNNYDGLVVTGAPVEHLPFEQVDYWQELKTILDWASSHVFSTMYLCWGAMAALNYRYGVRKVDLPQKVFGVFPQFLQDEYCFLTNGFDEVSLQPHSRMAGVSEKDLAADPRLQVLTWGPQAGPGLIATRDFSEVFALGHWEYGKTTIAEEYRRDQARGLANVPLPKNYFPHDDPTLEPLFSWRAHANLLWRNWLNWVYQTTPYDLAEVPGLRAEGRLGTDRSIRHDPDNPRSDGFRPLRADGYGLVPPVENCGGWPSSLASQPLDPTNVG
ncbi:homoserine O-succinyltransferase [Bifidobacterium aemilianum]|uniref:Homoserine O-acetyltransferase n=1 Tax=Bifidobacterium aemilianum TaxID=2493120 RepID=A0A366K7F5_9BIFI|nr:homoserine O-succinyltransferase [Bifidobacterium aemilianum]RBP97675.1 homoserine O-succinyltransferase [Bifidobacterium aemilianum]